MLRLASIVFANIHIVLIITNFLLQLMKMYAPKFYVTESDLNGENIPED